MFDVEKEGVSGEAWTNGRRNGWVDFSTGIFNIEVSGELLRAQSVKRLELLLVRGKKLEIELTDCTNSDAPVLALCLKKKRKQGHKRFDGLKHYKTAARLVHQTSTARSLSGYIGLE